MRFFTAIFLAIAFLSSSVPSANAFRSLEPRSRFLRTTVNHAKIPHPLLPPRAGSSALLASKQETVNTLAKVSSVVTATMCTYYLHNVYRMTPVHASAFVSLISSVLLPEKLALAALCGSFAGMAKMAVIPTLYSTCLLDSALLLGILCALMLGLFDNKGWLVGKGGRLGTVAQCACTLQFIAYRYGKNVLKLNLKVGRPRTAAALTDFSLYQQVSVREQLVPLVLYSVAGALFMRTWKYLTSKLPKRLCNTVGAVGISGLVASYTLPPTAAGAAFCGSFVAMSNSYTLPSTVALILASALAGASQLGLTGVLLGGWGGKLGTAALLGVLAYQVLTKTAGTIASVFRKSA